MTARSAQDEILVVGLDDWVQFPEVDWVLRHDLAPDDAAAQEVPREVVLARCIEVLGDLLRDGLVTVGDVGQHGFSPRSGSVPEILARVLEDWRALDAPPNLGDVAWLCNTPAGDSRAEQVLAAEQAGGPAG